MGGETAGDFQDWELLADSDSSTFCNYLEIEDVSEAMIHVDYFSAGGSSRYAKVPADEEGCVSDNTTTIRDDPGAYYIQSPRKGSGELWSDSGSDLSDKQIKVLDSDSNSEFKEQVAVEFKETGELGGKDGNLLGYDESKLADFDVENEIIQRGSIDLRDSEQIDHDSGKNQFSSDSDGDELAAATMSGGKNSIVEEKDCSDHQCDEHGNGSSIEEEEEKLEADEINRKRIARCNVPFELLLRYCYLLRANPVWSSLSVAAAVAGLVILGRKLYRMKHKRRTLPLRITVDDKKMSQFTSRAARLNEQAYSVVVRHVPMITHNLPPSGAALMSLR